MCGFFAIIKKKKIKEKFFFNSSNLIKHRGPNHNSLVDNKKILIRFFRLSIRDVSKKSNQPMLSEDSRYLMAFNGEIYNTKELIKRYKLGKSFNYKSDTKILFYLLCKYKLSILKHIKGMFSIIFTDNKNNISYIIRDRFGIKPLYYSDHTDGLIISSEIKPIINYRKKVKVNFKAVSDFFLKGFMDHDEKTLIKNINSVEPGHYLEIKGKNLKKIKY